MGRKTDVRRDSRPQSPELFSDKDQKAELEARNGLLQFDEVIRLVGEVEGGKPFKLRPSTIQSLQRIAIQDIYVCAGTYRTKAVFIHGTDHQPPPAADVPQLACSEGRLDVSVMENLLSTLLARQLVDVHAAAGGQKSQNEPA